MNSNTEISLHRHSSNCDHYWYPRPAESNGPFLLEVIDAEVTSELLVQEGMWHGFHWERNMPKSVMTMKAVSRFVAGQTGE